MKLTHAASEVGRGRLDTRADIKSNDEVGVLANAFNGMMENLDSVTVSKDYLDNIIESMVDSLVVLNADGRIRTVNRATLDLLGYREDELIGKHVALLLAQEEAFIGTQLEEVLARASVRDLMLTFRTKSGEKIPVSLSNSVMSDGDGRLQGIVCVAQDVSERRRAEQELIGSKAQLSAVLDTAGEGIIAINSAGTIMMTNREVENIWGYQQDELLGKKLSTLMLEKYPEAHAAGLHRYLESGVAYVLGKPLELEGLRKDDSTFPLELLITETKIGEEIFFTGAVRDISERRQAEDKIKTSLQEKEVLLKEINHRVKNNLQIISSLLDLQGRDIQDEQALRSFQVSKDRIRAMALVHEKLYQSEDLARIDFGEYINSLATDLGSSYGLGSRDIDLQIDVENILLGVDTAILCGVIVNELVANSLKHAFPGDRSGEIVISFREVDGQYTMIFKDDGVGLPEDLDVSRPSSLGLTIVNALTGQLGGTIDISRNGGSEISITFPAK